MGVYDTATKLASEIKNSKEYKDFRRSMKEVKRDKNCEELLKAYRSSQVELQTHMIQRKEIDKKTKKRIEDTQKKVSNNKKLINYLNNEQKFTQLMNNINNIIGKTVEKDYE